MAMLPIRTFGDPVLKDQCLEAPDAAGVQDLVRDMIDSLPRPGGAGLSANQVGVMKRVFIYDDEDEIKACINPRIISASEEMEEAVEGCLSVPGIGVPVNRHLAIELEYTDLNGETLRLKVEGWLARVFQHEIDHLDGKLILDRTDRASRVEALEELQGGQTPPHRFGHDEHAL